MSHAVSSQATRKDVGLSIENIRHLEAQARAAVLDARRQAARIVAEAREEADAIRRAAPTRHRESPGAPDSAELAELTDLIRTLVAELTDLRDGAKQSIRREGTRLARELATLIVGQVAQRDVSVAQTNLERVMRLTRREGEIRLLVNPRQLGLLRKYCAELVESIGFNGQARLIGSEEISPGSVRLDSRSGQIDATLETQLAGIGQALSPEPNGGQYAAAG
jgi:flagellar assembly protein FliH